MYTSESTLLMLCCIYQCQKKPEAYKLAGKLIKYFNTPKNMFTVQYNVQSLFVNHFENFSRVIDTLM